MKKKKASDLFDSSLRKTFDSVTTPTDTERVIEATNKTLDQYGKTFKDLAEFDKNTERCDGKYPNLDVVKYQSNSGTNSQFSSLKGERNRLIHQIREEERQRLMGEVEGMKLKFDPDSKDDRFIDPLTVDGYNFALEDIKSLLSPKN